MRKTWSQLAPFVDAGRHTEVAAFLAIQEKEARWWRDASIAYFQTFSKRPLPPGAAPPERTLEEYLAIDIPYAPGLSDESAEAELRSARMAQRAHAALATLAAATVCAAAGAQGASQPEQDHPLLSSLFHDHAVLQRERPARVWGWSTPGDSITVSIAQVEAVARADATGRWMATLPAMQAGGPYSLKVHSATGATAHSNDILVGDVWLCSGQSNMVLQVHRALDARAEIARAANDSIRMLDLVHEPTPLAHVASVAPWRVSSPSTVPDFSAACFYFARELQKTVNVPMGLINSAWGGSRIQAWMSAESLRSIGENDALLKLLSLHAKDPEAAIDRRGERWKTWWRTHAGARASAEPWGASPDISRSWPTVPAATRPWEEWGVPALARYDGIVWYRTSVTLDARQATQRATLSFGPVDEVDTTWVNGKTVGYTSGAGTHRSYELDAETLHAGENTIAIAALDTYSTGGMLGDASNSPRV